MDAIFGIDFGTTNSALSVNRGGKVEVINVDPFNAIGKTMRTVLYFNEENEIFVGQEAVDQYVNDDAFGRFMQSIKSFLPSKAFESTNVYGKNYTIEDLVAIVLKKIKAIGEDYVGHAVDSVVLGRPVVFSEDAEKDVLAQLRLEKAAKKAGFKEVQFQYEPIAAALTFEETLSRGEEKVVFIGDFGGGTSDFTVIRLRGGNVANFERKNDVLSLGGVYVGGDSFDSRIMWEKITKYFGRDVKYRAMGKDDWLEMPIGIIRTLCQWHLIPLLREKRTRELIRVIKGVADDRQAVENLESLIADNFGFMLFQTIEKAKCELSSLEHSQIFFRERNLVINEAISRSEFEEINTENIEKIAHCVDDTIAKAGMAANDIDTVFITGGTSYIPCIQNLFVERFGREKLRQMDAFTSVVHGLGASASFLF